MKGAIIPETELYYRITANVSRSNGFAEAWGWFFLAVMVSFMGGYLFRLLGTLLPVSYKQKELPRAALIDTSL